MSKYIIHIEVTVGFGPDIRDQMEFPEETRDLSLIMGTCAFCREAQSIEHAIDILYDDLYEELGLSLHDTITPELHHLLWQTFRAWGLDLDVLEDTGYGDGWISSKGFKPEYGPLLVWHKGEAVDINVVELKPLTAFRVEGTIERIEIDNTSFGNPNPALTEYHPSAPLGNCTVIRSESTKEFNETEKGWEMDDRPALGNCTNIDRK